MPYSSAVLRPLALSSLMTLLLAACSPGGGTGPVTPPPPPPPLEGVQFDLKVGQADLRVDYSLSSASLSTQVVQAASRYALGQVGVDGVLSAQQTSGRYVNLLWQLSRGSKAITQDVKLQAFAGGTPYEFTHKAGTFWGAALNLKNTSDTVTLQGNLLEGRIAASAPGYSGGPYYFPPSVSRAQLSARGLYVDIGITSQTPASTAVSLLRDPGGNADLEFVAGDILPKGVYQFAATFDKPLSTNGSYVLIATSASWDLTADRSKRLSTLEAPSSGTTLGAMKLGSIEPKVGSVPSELGLTAVVGQNAETPVVLIGGDYNARWVYSLELLDPSGTFTLSGAASGVAQTADEVRYSTGVARTPTVRATCSSGGQKTAKLILRTNSSALPQRELPLTLNCLNPLSARTVWSRDVLKTPPSAFSPDGIQFVILAEQPDYSQRIELRRSSDGSLVRELGRPASRQQALDWNKTGDLIASVSAEGGGNLRLWRVADGSLRAAVPLPSGADTSSTFSVAFSPDGQRVLVNAPFDEGSGVVYDLDGKKLFALGQPKTGQPLVWAPNGQMLASLTWRSAPSPQDFIASLELFRAQDGSSLRRFDLPGRYWQPKPTFASDSKSVLLVGNPDEPRKVRVDVQSGALTQFSRLDMPDGFVYAPWLALPDPTQFLVWTEQELRIYSWSKDALVRSYRVPTNTQIMAVNLSPTGTELYLTLRPQAFAYVGAMYTEATTLNFVPLRRLGAFLSGVDDLSVLSGDQLGASGREGQALDFALSSGADRAAWRPADFEVPSGWVLPSPNRQRVLASAGGDLLYVWSAASRQRESTVALPFALSQSTQASVRWSPDSALFVVAKNKSNSVADTTDNFVIYTVSGQKVFSGQFTGGSFYDVGPVLEWSGNGKRLRVGDTLWDVDGKGLVRRAAQGMGWGALNPEGSKMFSATVDQYASEPGTLIRVVSAQDGSDLARHKLPGEKPNIYARNVVVYAQAWSPDSSYVLAALGPDYIEVGKSTFRLTLFSASSARPIQTVLENLPQPSSMTWFKQNGKDMVGIGFVDGSVRLLALE